MSKHSKSSLKGDSGLVEIKSEFDAEFRRFSVDRSKVTKFDDFNNILTKLHLLHTIPFVITYTDPRGDLLPVNNDDNFNLALCVAKPVLRIILQKKGESYGEVNGYGTLTVKKRNPISKILSSEPPVAGAKPRLNIGMPEDFRRVSAIIDVDIVPETHRRVKLMKNGSDKPLGFYIRDGTSVRVTPQGLEKVPGIFISRLVPGGLAESTGLLAVNDEVLEVNGIEVGGKTLDQVTDMMVANSSNLIITVKPVNQRLTLAPQRGGVGRYSQMSSASHMSSASGHSGHSRQSSKSFDSDLVEHDDEDEVEDFLNKTEKSEASMKSGRSDVSLKSGRSDVSLKSGKSDKSETSSKSGKIDKHSKTSESGQSNGGQKYDSGDTKQESEGPVVTL